MGYNYVIERSAGSELLLVPDEEIDPETYPIEAKDIAEMIREMFYSSATKFGEDELKMALELYDAAKAGSWDLLQKVDVVRKSAKQRYYQGS